MNEGETFQNVANFEKHTNALKAVVLSRAVQNDASGCIKLFEIACRKLNQPNLSYLDNARFDKNLANAIYNFLIVECDLSQTDGSNPDNFWHGIKNIILALRSQFLSEL